MVYVLDTSPPLFVIEVGSNHRLVCAFIVWLATRRLRLHHIRGEKKEEEKQEQVTSTSRSVPKATAYIFHEVLTTGMCKTQGDVAYMSLCEHDIQHNVLRYFLNVHT